MTAKLTITQINYLNIGLMLVSAVCAFFFPFQTFLFVYAVLGPAHYLTEISWLHDKKYFTRGKYDYLFLLLAGVLITIFNFNLAPNVPKGAGEIITFVAFASALIFVTVKNTGMRAVLIFLSLIISSFLTNSEIFESIFGVFLPTLIHVFFFTGCFILVGALRGKSFSGILSLVVFAIVAFGFFLIPHNWNYIPDEYVKGAYGYLKDDGSFTHGFIGLNYQIMTIFNLHDFGKPTVSFGDFVNSVNTYLYSSSLALAIMSFIGFAYMYHYLNWFSKTSIIQWHNIPRSRFIGVIVLWIASLALYAYDYAVGLQWLFFLSFTHVLLEFPLNHLTFINIGKEIGGIFSGKSTATMKTAAQSSKR